MGSTSKEKIPLTESNWKQNFEKVISNCETKAEELEKLACDNNEVKGFLTDYKKFGRNASSKYIELQEREYKDFDKDIRGSIGEDMTFYQQQCNSYYNPILENIKKNCPIEVNNATRILKNEVNNNATRILKNEVNNVKGILKNTVNNAKGISKNELIIKIFTGLVYLFGICSIVFLIITIVYYIMRMNQGKKWKELIMKNDPSADSAFIEYKEKDRLTEKFFWFFISSFVLTVVSFLVLFYSY